MGVSVEYLQAHKVTGRLSYRRVLPPELRPFLPPAAPDMRPLTEVKRSLGATSILATGALERFRAAEAEFASMIAQALRVQARAEATARGAYDTLDPARIDYLGKVFEIELLKRDAAAIWAKGSDRTDRMRAGWSENLGNFRRWQGEGDMEAIEAEWQEAAHALLDDQGLTIDPASGGLRLLCRELNAATIRVAPVALAQLNGETLPALTPPPPMPPPSPGVAAYPSPSTSFAAIAEDILENSVPPVGQSTQEGMRTALRFFREVNGPLRPSQITRALVTAWIRVMAQRPAKLPSSERLLGLPALADIYADRPDVPRMSQTTLSRHVANLSSLWTKAQGDGHIAEEAPNPFGRRKFEITPPPEEPQEFSAEELTAIFSLPIFTDGKRPLGGKGETSYWMPLLMLWTGARPEEIAQLVVTDFRQDADGSWMLRITDEGTHPHKVKRSLKTTKKGTGRRTFAIPQALLDLNILDYVTALRDAKETALFPKLRTKGKRQLLFAGWGEWWNLYLQTAGVLPPPGKGRRASREFRHNWTTQARACGIPQDAREYIQGHSKGAATSNEGYGRKGAHGLRGNDIAFPAVDFSGLRPWKAPPS